MSPEKNARQNDNLNIDTKLFENVVKFKCLQTSLKINKTCMHK